MSSGFQRLVDEQTSPMGRRARPSADELVARTDLGAWRMRVGFSRLRESAGSLAKSIAGERETMAKALAAERERCRTEQREEFRQRFAGADEQARRAAASGRFSPVDPPNLASAGPEEQ